MTRTKKGTIIRECVNGTAACPAHVAPYPLLVYLVTEEGVLVVGINRIIRSWIVVTP